MRKGTEMKEKRVELSQVPGKFWVYNQHDHAIGYIQVTPGFGKEMGPFIQALELLGALRGVVSLTADRNHEWALDAIDQIAKRAIAKADSNFPIPG